MISPVRQNSDYLSIYSFMSTRRTEQFDLMGITEGIRLILDQTLTEAEYDETQIERWNRSIHHQCRQMLRQRRGDSSKILLSTMILSKKDPQLHLSNACLWDFAVDGSTNIK